MRWVCAGCGCRYAAGAPCCPECRATGHEEEEMPKITVGGGPSNALGQDPDEPEAGPAQDPAPEPPPVSAPKAEHVDHAVEALGVPRDEAESMTKPDLVELARADDPEPEPAKPQPKPKGASNG